MSSPPKRIPRAPLADGAVSYHALDCFVEDWHQRCLADAEYVAHLGEQLVPRHPTRRLENELDRLANGRLEPGSTNQLSIFDTATLQNAPVTVRVGSREVVRANGRPVPAFRVELAYQGLQTTSWVTATGEVIRRAFEEAGVVFIDDNGGGPGVRLKKA